MQRNISATLACDSVFVLFRRIILIMSQQDEYDPELETALDVTHNIYRCEQCRIVYKEIEVNIAHHFRCMICENWVLYCMKCGPPFKGDTQTCRKCVEKAGKKAGKFYVKMMRYPDIQPQEYQKWVHVRTKNPQMTYEHQFENIGKQLPSFLALVGSVMRKKEVRKRMADLLNPAKKQKRGII